MGATHWGDAPIYSGLYYNNDRPIGAALSRLLRKEHEKQILLIASDSPSVADGALVHLTSMLAEMRGSAVDVFWYTAYPGSNFRDLGLALRRFLLDLWKRQDIKIMGEREFVALSFEVSCCNSPREYFEKNIFALSSRIWDSEILVILDLQGLPSEAGRQDFCLLAHHFLVSTSRAWRGCVALISGGEEAAALHLTAPEAGIAQIIETSRTGLVSRTDECVSDADLFFEATSLIHPLIVLNQPAQRQVLDYVVHHASRAQSELTALLDREVLWRLGDGRVRISPAAMARFRGQSGNLASPFLDTIPNGAKVLSFQSPDRLTRQFSSLAEIEKMAQENTVVVDCFATAVAQKVRGGNPSSMLALLSETISSETLLATGEANSRSLLCYASQMLLTGYESFGAEFFILLEQLTYGYADYVQLVHGSSHPKNYEASRWLTNLGYVYDEVKKSCSHQPYADRVSIYQMAATYLSNLSPIDKKYWAEVRYSEGWQLLDCGKQAESIQVFETAANSLLNQYQNAIPENALLRVMAYELYVISLALAPERTLSPAMTCCLNEMLDGYGSLLRLEFIQKAFQVGRLIIDAPQTASTDITVIASYFDFHIALLIAQALRRACKRVPKIVFAPGRSSRELGNSELEPYVEGDFVLIIGAPDTPGAIGELISRRDPELVRLYQMRLLDNFGAAIDATDKNGHVYFLSGCGLAGNLYAWQAFIDRYYHTITLEKSHMEFVLLKELLIIPLASALEARIFNAVADRLVSKLRGKQREEANAALLRLRQTKPDQREQLIASLDGDLQATLVEISSNSSLADALSDAMANLRLGNLDLNELLSIAEFAYMLASQLQEKAIPASSEERTANSFALGFRQQRQAIIDLRDTYLANARMDVEKANMCAEHLTTTLRNFRNAAKSMSKIA